MSSEAILTTIFSRGGIAVEFFSLPDDRQRLDESIAEIQRDSTILAIQHTVSTKNITNIKALSRKYQEFLNGESITSIDQLMTTHASYSKYRLE